MQNQPATQSTNEFTLKEFRQRIRSAARRCAALEGLRLGEYKVEIDCRTIPVATPEIPTHAEAWPEGDDLNYSMSIKDRGAFLREAGVAQHGACVHDRISTPAAWAASTPMRILVPGSTRLLWTHPSSFRPETGFRYLTK